MCSGKNWCQRPQSGDASSGVTGGGVGSFLRYFSALGSNGILIMFLSISYLEFAPNIGGVTLSTASNMQKWGQAALVGDKQATALEAVDSSSGSLLGLASFIVAVIFLSMLVLAARYACSCSPGYFNFWGFEHLNVVTLLFGTSVAIALIVSIINLGMRVVVSAKAAFGQLALVPEYIDKLGAVFPVQFKINLAIAAASGIALTLLELAPIVLNRFASQVAAGAGAPLFALQAASRGFAVAPLKNAARFCGSSALRMPFLLWAGCLCRSNHMCIPESIGFAWQGFLPACLLLLENVSHATAMRSTPTLRLLHRSCASGHSSA